MFKFITEDSNHGCIVPNVAFPINIGNTMPRFKVFMSSLSLSHQPAVVGIIQCFPQTQASPQSYHHILSCLLHLTSSRHLLISQIQDYSRPFQISLTTTSYPVFLIQLLPATYLKSQIQDFSRPYQISLTTTSCPVFFIQLLPATHFMSLASG